MLKFKEVCITPNVFHQSFVNDINYKDIKSVLENIKTAGFIIGLNNKDWYANVLENINKIESQKIRIVFLELVRILKDREAIQGHPKGDINPKSELDWIKIALAIDHIRKIDYLISSKISDSHIMSVQQLEDISISDTFGNIGSEHFIKTDEDLKQILLSLLAYSKKVTIIDPYFNLSELRYKKTLKLIAECLGERRGFREKGTIIINSSNKTEVRENWKNTINDIFKDYGHIVKVHIWDRKSDISLKLHERYIFTNKRGIYFGAGTDVDPYQQCECGIKSYESLGMLRSQYEENSSAYSLIKTIQ